jgi:hypothetical protein
VGEAFSSSKAHQMFGDQFTRVGYAFLREGLQCGMSWSVDLVLRASMTFNVKP